MRNRHLRSSLRHLPLLAAALLVLVPDIRADEAPVCSPAGVLASAAVGEATVVAALALPDWSAFDVAAPVLPDVAARVAAPPAVQAAAVIPHVLSGTIVSGGSFAAALRRAGVGAPTVDAIVRQMDSIFDFRRARPGDHYTLVRNAEGSIVEFTYDSVSHEKYRVFRQGTALVAEKKGGEFVRRTARLAGIVTSTLYDAIQGLGEAPSLAHDFADIFAYDVDFARGLQRGDEFQILYERLYRTDASGHERFVRPGRIHAAKYQGRSGEHTAIYFQSDTGHGGYYRPDGTPMRRSFLVAPLQYTRMTSNFSAARFHPILKYTRPHPGIDYAAPEGTPLWSVGDGKVIQMGWMGGYGQLVTIEHANGYTSYYAHMSRFAKGLKVGSTVRQKQVIGYVGQTGLATGPHVCFRMAKDGVYVNPASLRAKGVVLESAANDKEFRATRQTLLAGLRSSQFVAIDEAL